MPQRLRDILGQDANIRVAVVERAADIGPELGPGPRPVIIEALSTLGVEIFTNETVSGVDSEGVTTASGLRIPSKTVIWTGGIRASALTEQIPGEKDALGRIIVDGSLRVPGLKNVFATGDTAYAATDDEGHIALLSCQHALILGRYAGYNAAADLLGEPTKTYRQPVYVTCLDLGPWGAVLTTGWDRVVSGLSAAEAKIKKILINTKLIYPPPATDRVFALGEARPEVDRAAQEFATKA
ncbi:NADH dehydrogenase family protein [Pleurotus pulmonarius]